jgi:Kef-type K+ transport system membrane component KefB
MALDAQQAALLVRVTARVSAVLVAANLITAARRAYAIASRALRTADVATFLAFLASHTVHFICVLLLAGATGGDNIRNAGGWVLVVMAALVFYAGAAVVVRVKMRPASWRSSLERRSETLLLAIVWLVFFQAYALRVLQSWLFAALAVLLAYSVAGLLRAALRSQTTPVSS